jgi:hypothetical protein
MLQEDLVGVDSQYFAAHVQTAENVSALLQEQEDMLPPWRCLPVDMMVDTPSPRDIENGMGRKTC